VAGYNSASFPVLEIMRFACLRLLPLTLSLTLCACASSHGTSTSWPYPEEPRAAPPGTPQESAPGVPQAIPPSTSPMPGEKPLGSYPKTADEISNAAVLSLLTQAREQRGAGHPDQAAAALERAVRIEPRNYFVWAALAQVHLDQGSYDQAETFAQKSNMLARGNLYVEVENWKTIAAARKGRGDGAGAQQAQVRVDEIQRVLAGG
jgi:tetratricopeptide (TPR) repeat protein